MARITEHPILGAPEPKETVTFFYNGKTAYGLCRRTDRSCTQSSRRHGTSGIPENSIAPVGFFVPLDGVQTVSWWLMGNLMYVLA